MHDGANPGNLIDDPHMLLQPNDAVRLTDVAVIVVVSQREGSRGETIENVLVLAQLATDGFLDSLIEIGDLHSTSLLDLLLAFRLGSHPGYQPEPVAIRPSGQPIPVALHAHEVSILSVLERSESEVGELTTQDQRALGIDVDMVLTLVDWEVFGHYHTLNE